MKHFVFGYGSLMERASRLSTTPDAMCAYPIKVKGLKRGWWARTGVAGLSTTFLGCIQTDPFDPNAFVNGVAYQVSEEDLALTDAREMGYRRMEINASYIEDYVGGIENGATVWVYLNQFSNDEIPLENLPSQKFPIVQSYLDICLNGCLQMEEEYPIAKERHFAVDFIKSTFGWSSFWVNDRIYPRRPFIYVPNAFLIDQLLKDHLEDKTLFDNIYFE